MHSNDYEAAFGRFLEQTEYDEAEDALFSLVRAAFQAKKSRFAEKIEND